MKDLKLVLALIIELGNVIDKMAHTTGAAKYAALLGLMDEVAAIGAVDFTKLGESVKALDDAGKAELVAFLKEKLDLADDVMEKKIEDGVALAVKVEGMVQEILALVASFKAA